MIEKLASLRKKSTKVFGKALEREILGGGGERDLRSLPRGPCLKKVFSGWTFEICDFFFGFVNCGNVHLP